MKYLLFIISLALCGCGSTLRLTSNGNLLLFKSKDGELSCYSNKCCWPYKEKLMICTEAGIDNMLVSIKYVPEK